MLVFISRLNLSFLDRLENYIRNLNSIPLVS